MHLPLQLHRSTHQGTMTRYPYTPRHAGCATFPVRRCFTLTVGVSLLHSPGTHLAAWAGNPRAVSPCGTHCPVRRLWPVRPQGALAQTHCSTNVQERQEEACYARGNSSPRLKTGDSLPQQVERRSGPAPTIHSMNRQVKPVYSRGDPCGRPGGGVGLGHRPHCWNVNLTPMGRPLRSPLRTGALGAAMLSAT